MAAPAAAAAAVTTAQNETCRISPAAEGGREGQVPGTEPDQNNGKKKLNPRHTHTHIPC